MKKILFLLPLILALLVSGTVEAKKKKYPNGDYYEGEWKKGQPNGFGKMIYANGNVYEGNWGNGLPNGEGKMIYKGGGVYEGNWYLGIISGHGKMTYKSGSIYKGMWEGGKRWREGSMIYSTGSTYNGHWEADIRKGEGKLYSNGNFCTGQWNGEYFVGTGVLYKNDVSLDGRFSQDLKIFSGKCNIISPNRNATIIGDIEIANRDYKKIDTIIYSTAQYKGEIHNFQREGNGIMSFDLYKTKITGEWKDDDFIQGHASLIYDSETFDYTIQRQNGASYAINVQNRSASIANLTKVLYFKTYNISIPQQLFEVIAPTIKDRRLKKEQEIKQAQNKQRQEYIAQKTNSFNINSYLWSISDINRLKQHNIAKFSQVLKGEKVLLYGTIADFFTGEGDNTAAAYWSNGLLPSTYTQYFIELQGGVVVQAHSDEIANFNRGETIYIIADVRKDEYRGYVFDARYEIITTSLTEMKNKLCKPLGDGVQPELEYESMKLVKNIYR